MRSIENPFGRFGSRAPRPLSHRLDAHYDRAAPGWGDKMRRLGYFKAYAGYLRAHCPTARAAPRVIDIGAGTGSFAEAFVTAHGNSARITLLDPSPAMLARARTALNAYGIDPALVQARLGDPCGGPFDHALAAHVIEHCPDPARALREMYDLLHPGGMLHLVVSKPHWCNAIIWLQWRHQTFSEADITALLHAAGFERCAAYRFPSGPPSRTSFALRARKPTGPARGSSAPHGREIR